MNDIAIESKFCFLGSKAALYAVRRLIERKRAKDPHIDIENLIDSIREFEEHFESRLHELGE